MVSRQSRRSYRLVKKPQDHKALNPYTKTVAENRARQGGVKTNLLHGQTRFRDLGKGIKTRFSFTMASACAR
jgi:hypothetical protein